MFEFLDSNHAITIIKKDHDKVKDLFDQFEDATTVAKKCKIAAEAIMELKIHAAIEEEIFYPAVRKPIGKKIMNEADEEHHVAKLLIAELEMMDGTESHYEAKFKVLSENVRHHIKEEESEMLPKSKPVAIDMDVLGKKLLARKQQLMKTGVAVFAEEKMVKASRGQGDSSAQTAVKRSALSKSVRAAISSRHKATSSTTKKPVMATKTLNASKKK